MRYSSRSFRQKVVDVVGQCGLPQNPTDEVYERCGLGFKKARCSQPGRYSQPLPMRTVYRITHIPAPPPTDSAKIYVNDHLGGLENTKLVHSFHPTIHLNNPVTVYRPRLPILCMKDTLQDRIYEPSTFEEKEIVELPIEVTKRRPFSARTCKTQPLKIHEPSQPINRTLSARRPNSQNLSAYSSDADDRCISLHELKTGKIDPELIQKEQEKTENLRRIVPEEKEPYYIEEKPPEEEPKEPPNKRLLYIKKLLRDYMGKNYYNYEEEDEQQESGQLENVLNENETEQPDEGQ